MGELIPIKDVSIAAALTDESGMTVGTERKARPCTVCGVMQEPRVIPELNMVIHRPPICEACMKNAEEAERMEAEAFRRKNAEKELMLCGVPPEFVKYSFITGRNGTINWTGKTKDAVQVCVQYAMKPEGAILLMGKTGRGKTHVAIAIMRDVVIKGGKARFVSCLDLMNSLRAVYRARNDDDEDSSEQEVLSRIGRGLVVLDDLGATRVTPMVRDSLTLIVDRCERRGQPLVVTTNLTIPEIGEKFDERLASRLVGLCKSPERVITLEGIDHRLPKAKR